MRKKGPACPGLVFDKAPVLHALRGGHSKEIESARQLTYIQSPLRGNIFKLPYKHSVSGKNGDGSLKK